MFFKKEQLHIRQLSKTCLKDKEIKRNILVTLSIYVNSYVDQTWLDGPFPIQMWNCFNQYKKVTVMEVGEMGIFVPLRRLFLKYKIVGVMGIEWESA